LFFLSILIYTPNNKNVRAINTIEAAEPNANIERQQIACFIERALVAAEKKNISISNDNQFPFDDVGTIADWALDSMKFCYNNQILQGYNRLISPLGKTTREQAIAIIKRTYDKFSGTQISIPGNLDIIKPPIDMSKISDVIPVGIQNYTITSEEAKFSAIDFEAGDMFFPKYDTRLKLYASTTSKKPGSKPTISISDLDEKSLKLASIVIPSLKPDDNKPSLTIPQLKPTDNISISPKITTPFHPDLSMYTDASYSAFIDKNENSVRWFYFNLTGATGASKVVWQVSTSPFLGFNINWRNPAGLVASGQVVASTKEFSINFAEFADNKKVSVPIPQHQKTYYVRAVPINSLGQPIGDPGEGMAVVYGEKSVSPPTQSIITPSFELWTPKETHQGRPGTEFPDWPVKVDEVGFDSEKTLPRFFHFHGIDPEVHTLIFQVSAAPFPQVGGAYPETPSLVFEKQFSLPTNTYAYGSGFSNEQFPATVPINFRDFAPSPDQLKPGECKKYYARGIALKSTNNPGEVEADYSQTITVNYFKREPITVIVPKVEYVNASLPEVNIKNYTPAQWETWDYMRHYIVYRPPQWYEIQNKWKNSVTGAILEPYEVHRRNGFSEEQYTNEIIPLVLPVGAEVYFPPATHRDQAWYEDLFDIVTAFFENVWSAINEIYNVIQQAYNGLKAAIIENLAYLCPFPELRDEFKAALEACVNAGLMTLGLPPTLPNMDKLIDEGIDYMAEVVLTETGIPPNEITKGMVNELAHELEQKVRESSNQPHSNPIDSPFLKLNPKKIYRPAYIELEIKNPSSTVASVQGSINLDVTFEMNRNAVNNLDLRYDSRYGDGQFEANLHEYAIYKDHFIYGLSAGSVDIQNTGASIIYDIFEPVKGWKIPSLRPGEVRTVRIYLTPKDSGRQSRYPSGEPMDWEKNDFYNMYFMNQDLKITYFTLHEFFPTPVEYMQQYMKGYIDTTPPDIYLYHGETFNGIGPVTPHSYYSYERINKPVSSYWSK
jgi:hypothetical protein